MESMLEYALLWKLQKSSARYYHKKEDGMIYLDNAATTWPKPEAVYAAMDKAGREEAGNPGRSGHALSLAAGRVVEDARLAVASLLGLPHPERLIFTLNATDALNLALFGLLRPGDHVVTDSLGHNSLTRPLAVLETEGVAVTKVSADPVNGADPQEIKRALRPKTRLIAVTHVSNVAGTTNPLPEIQAVAQAAGVRLLVDASQSAGCRPLPVVPDLLAFPGHKALLGPQGTGALYAGPEIDLRPLRFGGTGSFSESLTQPAILPDRYESGTANTPGLAGLAAGARFLQAKGLAAVAAEEARLANILLDGLAQIQGVRIYGPPPGPERAGVVSFRIKGLPPVDIAAILDQSFGIAVRAGLHCAPDAHRSLGTLEGGTVRASLSPLNTEADAEAFVAAVASIAGEVF
jgi:cysteine desulfurase family protein